VALVAGSASSAGATTSGPWTLDNPPKPVPTQGAFQAVAAIPGTGDYWAVGWTREGSAHNRAFIEERTASGWTHFPLPKTTQGEALFGVVAKSASSAWAVGYGPRVHGSAQVPLALFWNGTSWKRVAAANAGKGAFAAVRVTGAGLVVAVGHSVKGAQSESLVERWNGSEFVRIPAHRHRAWLTDVTGGPGGALWALGPGLLHHSRGASTWQSVPLPPASSFGANTAYGLSRIFETAPGVLWAFGSAERFPAGTFKAVIMRCQNGSWTIFPGLTAGAQITGATPDGATGFLLTGTDPQGIFVWRDDGSTITAMTVAQPGSNPLSASSLDITEAQSGVAELGGWWFTKCTAPCRTGMFPLAERSP
jgi:hypothetical protein